MLPAMRIGLTGGIGSGKSTVAALMAKVGAYCIDADAISRAVTAPGGAAISAIRDAFGSAVINSEGALDRAGMRALIFSKPAARSRLEGIIHPLVQAAIHQATEQAVVQQTRLIVHDIPLLVESAHWRSSLDAILVVDCKEHTQIARVMERSQLPMHEVQAIITAQAPRAKRLAAADMVIFNDGITLGELESLVPQICAQFGL